MIPLDDDGEMLLYEDFLEGPMQIWSQGDRFARAARPGSEQGCPQFTEWIKEQISRQEGRG